VSLLDLSRWQFAITVMFHMTFPAITGCAHPWGRCVWPTSSASTPVASIAASMHAEFKEPLYSAPRS
jgi:hypothetical protein